MTYHRKGREQSRPFLFEVVMNKPRILVFGKSNCPWCVRAIDLLNSRRLPFTYVNLEESRDMVPEFRRLTNDAKTVPQILVGSHLIGGFDQLKEADSNNQLQQLLGGM